MAGIAFDYVFNDSHSSRHKRAVVVSSYASVALHLVSESIKWKIAVILVHVIKSTQILRLRLLSTFVDIGMIKLINYNTNTGLRASNSINDKRNEFCTIESSE